MAVKCTVGMGSPVCKAWTPGLDMHQQLHSVDLACDGDWT